LRKKEERSMAPTASDLTESLVSGSAIDLAYSVQLECGLSSEAIEISLLCNGQTVGTCTLSGVPPAGKFSISEPFVSCDLELTANPLTGELVGLSGGVTVTNPHAGQECPLLQLNGPTLLMRFAPGVGMIGKRFQIGKDEIPFDQHGGIQLATPNVLRFYVTDERRAVSNIGQMVKYRLFLKYPDFVFNTVAYVGKPAGNAGQYTDPESPWFNLFLGYYQIDAPVGTKEGGGWTRPFGYELSNGSWKVYEEDLVRLAKADWNWFSNWNYGTPADDIAAFDNIDLERSEVKQTGVRELGTWWHTVEMSNIEVASTYESCFPDAARLVLNSPSVTPMWRELFGAPCPRANERASFIPTVLRGSLLMAFREEDGQYHTRIFGGTLYPKKGDDDFLQAQMKALETLIEKEYSDLGFQSNPDQQAQPISPISPDGEPPPVDLGQDVKGPGPIAAPSPEEAKPTEKGDRP
jgi:hypothetical protein